MKVKNIMLSIAISISLFVCVSYATVNQDQEQQVLFCPEPDQLVRHGLWWEAGKLWKSYSQSFVQDIDSFIGAQWIGINVGKIICLYKGKQRITFPVALEPVHPLLVISPTAPNWITTEHDYKKCTSNDVKDCPFNIRKPKVFDNLYDQIKYRLNPNDQE